MAFMAAALPYIAAGVTAVSAISSAQAQAGAAKYNQRIAEQNAEMARQQGIAAEQAQRRHSEQVIGQMRANYAASGVDVGQGSPLDVLGESARMAELDALNTRYNYQVRATGYANQSDILGAEAKNATTSGMLNAVGGGVGTYYKLKYPNGVPPGDE